MAEKAPEGVQRIETVEAAKEQVEKWFEEWPKVPGIDGEIIATYPKAMVDVDLDRPDPQRYLMFFEIAKRTYKDGRIETEIRLRDLPIGRWISMAEGGVQYQERVGIYRTSYTNAPFNQFNQYDFLNTINAFRNELEGVQGATEGSALPDETLPEVGAFSDKLAQVVPSDENSSPRIPSSSQPNPGYMRAADAPLSVLSLSSTPDISVRTIEVDESSAPQPWGRRFMAQPAKLIYSNNSEERGYAITIASGEEVFGPDFAKRLFDMPDSLKNNWENPPFLSNIRTVSSAFISGELPENPENFNRLALKKKGQLEEK